MSLMPGSNRWRTLLAQYCCRVLVRRHKTVRGLRNVPREVERIEGGVTAWKSSTTLHRRPEIGRHVHSATAISRVVSNCNLT